jgi:hypothetical protein
LPYLSVYYEFLYYYPSYHFGIMISLRVILIALACSAISVAALPQTRTFKDGSAWSADKETNPNGSIETGANAPPLIAPNPAASPVPAPAVANSPAASTPAASSVPAPAVANSPAAAAPGVQAPAVPNPATNTNNNAADSNRTTSSTPVASNPSATNSASNNATSLPTPSTAAKNTNMINSDISGAVPAFAQQPVFGLAAAFIATYVMQVLL